ncbi:chloroplastic group IIA intron splicing facilitator CRS1, chloroplastic-like [Vicia villosa]|uniref:chloroplastic group IIA intron splicing facilitator CRS1, chloroplastic-like n=1 Tax=Vicia villosa TaxID=3911 RepID=UPI00273C270E|nr:chloroplastic group IIA intron splicing facilitator CRS1, chloroplastic-like [Vicia villosa]
MHPQLTNDEHAKMLKLAKVLPCHFALGRNRNLQGLACAILKLWEKSLVAKIAVKHGVQNTNNELMALELKVSYLQFLVWCQLLVKVLVCKA